jgi:predicted alpha/beta-hydrolase family hydrolase
MAPAPPQVVLFPGAGTSADHPSLVVLDTAISAVGAAVARVDFPYRRAGRRAPDRAPVLVAAVRDGVATHRRVGSDGVATPVIVGGRSMGGRMASIAVAGPGPGAVDAEPPLEVSGLILVSYPLHPPGRPERLRVEHLPRLRVPTLLVQGTRDPFGTAQDCRSYFETSETSVTVVPIEGGRHDLGRHHDEVAEVVAGWVAALLASR